MTEDRETKSTVLIVDADDSIRSAFKSVLHQAGYETFTAENPEEALRKIDEIRFDLIYIDIALGAKSGVDVLREIRKKKLPVNVLMMTAAPSAAVAKEVFELGAFGHISKPISADKLLRLTRLALRE